MLVFTCTSYPPSMIVFTLIAQRLLFSPFLKSSYRIYMAWNRGREKERILRGLYAILDGELQEAKMFLKPVNLFMEPAYCAAVAFPTSVSTIAERLRNGFYR